MPSDLNNPRYYVYYESGHYVVSPLGKGICGQDRQNRLGCVEELWQLMMRSTMTANLIKLTAAIGSRT